MRIIKIVGEIGWDVYARDIDRQLSFAKGEDVEVEIATPGGRIDEGLRMFNSLKNYQGEITFRMTGVVASMGSYVVLARGRENVLVEPNAIFMMHNPASCACGDYQVMGKLAKNLDDLSGHVAKTYADAAGKSVEEVRTMLDVTTYIYGEDIVAQGFAGRMTDSAPEPDADPAQAVALARVAVDACMQKVRAYEMSLAEAGEISAMVMSMTGHNNTPVAPAAPVEKKEAPIMNRTELQEKHPALCERLLAEGRKEGGEQMLETERARIKMICGFRAKFPKMHAVIDTAIMEGHDLAALNLNMMSAQAAADELAAGGGEGAAGATGGDAGGGAAGAEMKDGKMVTPEHLVDTSNSVAGMIGLSPQGGGAK